MQPGEKFSEYTIIRALGRGGQGAVYEVEDAVGLRWALKLSHALELGAADVMERFSREARWVSQKLHALPRDSGIFVGEHYGIIERRFYVKMRLLRGENLGQLLRREGQLAPQRALLLGSRIAKAIGTAHLANAVHRDLKPENVFVECDGTVQVLDWGCLQVLEAGHLGSTQACGPLCTPGYAALEQFLLPRRPLGRATDVYSLGVMLYEMLTGRHPFLGWSRQHHTPSTAPPVSPGPETGKLSADNAGRGSKLDPFGPTGSPLESSTRRDLPAQRRANGHRSHYPSMAVPLDALSTVAGIPLPLRETTPGSPDAGTVPSVPSSTAVTSTAVTSTAVTSTAVTSTAPEAPRLDSTTSDSTRTVPHRLSAQLGTERLPEDFGESVATRTLLPRADAPRPKRLAAARQGPAPNDNTSAPVELAADINLKPSKMSVADIVQRQRNVSPARIDAVSEPLWRLIASMLSHDPSSRPQDALGIADALDQELARLGASPGPAPAQVATTPPPDAASTASPGKTASHWHIPLVAIAAAGAMALFTYHHYAPDAEPVTVPLSAASTAPVARSGGDNPRAGRANAEPASPASTALHALKPKGPELETGKLETGKLEALPPNLGAGPQRRPARSTSAPGARAATTSGPLAVETRPETTSPSRPPRASSAPPRSRRTPAISAGLPTPPRAVTTQEPVPGRTPWIDPRSTTGRKKP